MAKHTRRQFLKVSAVTAAGALVACGAPGATGTDPDGGTPVDPELDGGTGADGGTDAGTEPVDAGQPLPPDEPELVMEAFNFPLGIASGDVTATRAMLWTRHDGTAPLRLRVWKMAGEVYAERVADVAVTPADGGFLHLDLDGLVAGERYRYAFFEVDAAGALLARSAIGRFRAALAPGVKTPLVVGACSCTKQGRTPAPLLHAGQREDLDLFLLLGDTSYNDGCVTRAEYRTQWAANLGSPEYRALRSGTSVLATWDDHEVTNDFNPETIDPAQLVTARDAYFETLPLRRDPVNPERLWKSVRWGDTAEFFVLDSRSERKPSTRFNGQPHQYLSPAQMSWLKAGLKASTATFKVILNSVPITNFGFSTFNPDGWLFYLQQRTEVLGWIEDEAITGVLWVAGDHHFASVGTVSALGRGTQALEVLAGPGAQAANTLYALLRPPRWPFATGDYNYVALHLDPGTGKVRVVFHGSDGGELHSGEYTP
jgi:alkaline phosphatase D